MRKKRIIGSFCCIVFVLSITGECVLGGSLSFLEKLPGPIKELPNPFKRKPVNKPQTYSDSDCIPAGQGGSVNKWSMISKMTLNKIINKSLEVITGVEDVFVIQEDITDTCMADKYLAYADQKSQLLSDASIHLLDAMADSLTNQKDRKALEAARDAVSQQLENGDKTDAVVSVGKGFDVYNEKLKECKEVDKTAMAIVWMDAKNLSVRNVEILSLGRHIFEFAEENIAWGVKNIDRLKPFGVYVKGLAVQTKALAQTPRLAAAHFDHHDNNLLAAAKKNNNKAIEAKLADENGLGEDADEILGKLFHFNLRLAVKKDFNEAYF